MDLYLLQFLRLTFSASAIKCFSGNKETKVVTDCQSAFDRCVNVTIKATSITTYACASKELMKLIGAEDDKCRDVGTGDTTAQYCLCKTDKCNFDSPQPGNKAKGFLINYVLNKKQDPKFLMDF